MFSVNSFSHTLLTLLFLLSGCVTPGSPGAVSQLPGLKPVGYLAPYQVGADALAWAEDWCEDPVEDAQTITFLEATADTPSLPATMLITTARMVAMVTIGPVMILAFGQDAETVDSRVKHWLPLITAGPNPDTVDYKTVKVVEGSYDDRHVSN